MITALQAASYISQRYKKEHGLEIDEMKLHKLLYFAQRESLIIHNLPLFEDQFVAWKYGPVMLCVRDAFRIKGLNSFICNDEMERLKDVFDSVFKRYAERPSWSLSILTHGENSWQRARIGVDPEVNGHNMMNNEDIRKDAERIRIRRAHFE